MGARREVNMVMAGSFQKQEERKARLHQLAEKGLAELYKLAADLKIGSEDLLRILADVQGIDPDLGRRIDYLWQIRFGRVSVKVPKPELKPPESSIFDAIYKLVGKKETYKVANVKDVLTELIEDVNYDGALHRVIPRINEILHAFFKGHLNLEEEQGISSGTTSEVPEFRKFELEILHENEPQYVFIYGKGVIINLIGDLPAEKLVKVLKDEGKWEA